MWTLRVRKGLGCAAPCNLCVLRVFSFGAIDVLGFSAGFLDAFFGELTRPLCSHRLQQKRVVRCLPYSNDRSREGVGEGARTQRAACHHRANRPSSERAATTHDDRVVISRNAICPNGPDRRYADRSHVFPRPVSIERHWEVTHSLSPHGPTR